MDTEKIELFGKYLAGDMSAEERTAFETDLSANAELAEDFRLYKYIDTDIRNSYASIERERLLKESIKGITDEFFPQRPVVIGRSRNIRYMISGVAATLLLGGVQLFLLLSHSVDIQEEVSSFYTTNFEVFGKTMGMESDLQVAIEAYNKRVYTGCSFV
jgi:anti-sigma factor RsiW